MVIEKAGSDKEATFNFPKDMKSTLTDIQSLVESFAEIIQAPKHLLPTYGRTVDGAHPHIETDENQRLYYVIVERGEELRRELATDTTICFIKYLTALLFLWLVITPQNSGKKWKISEGKCSLSRKNY